MAVVDVINSKAEKVAQVELPDSIYQVPVNPGVLHTVATMQLAARRAGTAAVKHRTDVTGSTRKLFRQKGTGRARRGDIKSPVMRGGGSVFGPDPRSYAYRVNKKVRRLALKMALSAKLNDNQLLVLDAFGLEQVKTKGFVAVLKSLGTSNALIVCGEPDTNLELSSRNVPKVKVLRTEGLNVVDIPKHDKLILVQSSLAGIQGRLLP